MPARLLLGAAALALSFGAHAQVYKCVDAQGKTVYLQSPCPAGAKSKKLDIQNSPAPSAAPAADAKKPGAKKPLTPEEEFRKRQTEREEAEKKATETAAKAKEREDNCQRAKASVAQLNSGIRISRLNDKGEREYLDEGQVAQERARNTQLVSKWCD